VLARFCCGAGATNAVTTRAYVARVTTARARTIAVAVQNGVQFLGKYVGWRLGWVRLSLELSSNPPW